MVLSQDEEAAPLLSEAAVVADFFTFLRAGGVSCGEQVVVVANSTELLPLLRSKATLQDLAMIAGEWVGVVRKMY